MIDHQNPTFPLRIIFDDGELETVDSSDELLNRFVGLDSSDASNGVWIRDALDRTVRLRLENGSIEVLELLPATR